MAIEAVTLEGRCKRIGKSIEKAFETMPPVYDREVLNERIFAPYAGSVPQYALDRGITLESAKTWGLGYDKKGGFLVFPVRRRDGALVGLVGRAAGPTAKRTHHNYFGLDKTRHLFGAQMLEPHKPVVIVEACIDAINTWQALKGEASVVAALGEGFSDRHAKTIAVQGVPAVYIFTDGDGAGRLMANKMAFALRGRVVTRIMECPWGPILEATADGRAVRKKIDPSDLPYDYIRRLYRDAPIIKRKIKWTNPPPFYDLVA
jgi:hypothetical protein